jgi:tetratricopeptide (TPR) repeat protein
MKIQTVRWFVLAVLVCMLLPTAAVFAQEEQSSDYTFEEYSYYDKAKKETDPAKKEAELFEFMDKFPESKLNPYILAEFKNLFDALMKQKKYDQVIAIAKKVLERHPDAMVAQQGLAGAYYFKQDYADYLKASEVIYAKSPATEPAYYMADAAIKINDVARAEKYTAEVEKGDRPLMKIDLAFKLFSLFAKTNDPKTEIWAQKLVQLCNATPDKPAAFNGGDWNAFRVSMVNPCYGYMGNAAMKASNFDRAAEMFTKILENNPKDAASHFYLGLAYWFGKKAKEAAPEFAKAVVLNAGVVSQRADEQLKKLLEQAQLADKYNEYIATAKTELGIQ